MVEATSEGEKPIVVETTINQQQYVAIEQLRAEGTFGTTDGEIIRRVFQEFVRQEGW
jgi:hypothetical protein